MTTWDFLLKVFEDLTTGKLYIVSLLVDCFQKGLPVLTLDNDDTIFHLTTSATFTFQWFGKLLKFFIIKWDTENCCYCFLLPTFDLCPNSNNFIFGICWIILMRFFLNLPEHLNVTIFLVESIISSQVSGSRPLSSFFSLTQNFQTCWS